MHTTRHQLLRYSIYLFIFSACVPIQSMNQQLLNSSNNHASTFFNPTASAPVQDFSTAISYDLHSGNYMTGTSSGELHKNNDKTKNLLKDQLAIPYPITLISFCSIVPSRIIIQQRHPTNPFGHLLHVIDQETNTVINTLENTPLITSISYYLKEGKNTLVLDTFNKKKFLGTYNFELKQNSITASHTDLCLKTNNFINCPLAKYIIIFKEDNSVNVLRDNNNGSSLLYTIKSSSPIEQVAFNNDSSIMALIGQEPLISINTTDPRSLLQTTNIYTSNPRTIVLLNTETGEVLPQSSQFTIDDSTSPKKIVSLSFRDQTLAILLEDGTLDFFDIPNTAQKNSLETLADAAIVDTNPISTEQSASPANTQPRTSPKSQSILNTIKALCASFYQKARTAPQVLLTIIPLLGGTYLLYKVTK